MGFDNLLKRRGRLSSKKQTPSFSYENIIGVNYADSIYGMKANQSPFGQDTDFGYPIGSIGKRRGYESMITSLGSGKMLGLNCWQHSAGDQLLAAWGTGLYLFSGDTTSVSKTSQADWQAGTSTDVDLTTSAGDILLNPGTLSEVVTLTADFDGTHSNTEVSSDKVQLAVATGVVESLDQSYTDAPGTTAGNGDGQTFTTGAGVTWLSKIILKCAAKTTNGNVALTVYDDADKTTTLGTKTIAISSTGEKTWAFDKPIAITESTQYYFEIVYDGFVGTFYVDNTSSTYAGGSYYDGGSVSSGKDLWFKTYTVVPVTGTYTHSTLDVSAQSDACGIKLTWNETSPAGTWITVEYRLSVNGGSTWGSWTSTTSGALVVPEGAEKTNLLVQWRANLNTSIESTNCSINDMTVASTYAKEGSWVSTVLDLTNTPSTATLTYNKTEPANTTVTVYARGSSNGTVFGDYLEVLASGDSIPLQRYIQVKVVLKTTLFSATPTFSDFTIAASSSYTTPNLLDIGPLGRGSNHLSGNRVRFCNYNDWLLMADGNRPFMAYITDDTQETGTAQAGAASTITLKAGASAIDDFYNNAFITTTSGTGSGQTRFISDYNGGTKVATVSVAWGTQPDATTGYSIGSAVKVRNLGVDPPLTALTDNDAGSGSGPNGAYRYKVTYVNADGVESNPGPASGGVTVADNSIALTDIPVDASTGNTTAKRRIYRTAAGGSVYKYLTEIADNTTTTYTDSTTDAALGALMEDNNNIPPTSCTLVYEFTSYVFYVDGYDVWYSKAGSPDQVPNITGDIQQMGFPDEVLSIQNHPTALVFSGQNFISTITSNSGFIFDSDVTVDTTTMRVIDNHGGLSQEATVMALSPNLRSTLLLNTDTGIRATVPGLQDNSIESVPLSKNIQKYYDLSINRDQAAGVFFNNYYLYSMEYQASAEAESEHLTFVYDLRTEEWYGPWNFGMSCYTIVGNVLYAGDCSAGKVYRMFTGYSDAGSNIKMIADLPMRAPAGENGKVKFKKLILIVNADSDTTSTVVKVKVDERDTSISLGALTSSFTGDERPGHNSIRTKKYVIPLPKGSTYSLRIEDDSTNPVIIEKIITEYEVLPLSN